MTNRIKFSSWAIFAATLLALNCVYVVILRFGFGIHEKSSLLLDMIIFNVIVAPVSFGSFLAFVMLTLSILLAGGVSLSMKSQRGWATTSGFLACALFICSYLSRIGFAMSSSNLVLLGLVIGVLSGALGLLIVVSARGLIHLRGW